MSRADPSTRRLGPSLGAALAAAWLGCAAHPASLPAPPPALPALPPEAGRASARRGGASAAVEQALARLTLEEKVAQLVMAYAPPGDGPLRQGGVILMGKALRDPATLRARVEALQRRSTLPLLVAVDLEGGS